ncbi:hypothetical protein K7X08_006313 [Anisodus acutangulus]|uniref:Uncharacterized protein n=1 Tax=Anisodus acutangulus TaxID=402998 RepID=A0A9Q1MV82_9SOLA|nr:hypothetical protein K7X08_006313 [Anisodus acutangulus]
MTHMKNGHWVDDASAKIHDKVKEFVDEQIHEIEEGADVDPIVDAAFMKIVGEKSEYYRGQGLGVKPSSRKSMNRIQEQLQAQQKKREKVEFKLMKVQNQLEEERKNRKVMKARLVREQENREVMEARLVREQENREVMEARLVREQKMLREGLVELIPHMQNGHVFT